jgi:hypothetical protein
MEFEEHNKRRCVYFGRFRDATIQDNKHRIRRKDEYLQYRYGFTIDIRESNGVLLVTIWLCVITPPARFVKWLFLQLISFRSAFSTCCQVHISSSPWLLHDSDLHPIDANSHNIMVLLLDLARLTTSASGPGYHYSTDHDHHIEQRTRAFAEGLLHKSNRLVLVDVSCVCVWGTYGIRYR